jgi:FlaA1/EpsC-like NDP-sugar epimerase
MRVAWVPSSGALLGNAEQHTKARVYGSIRQLRGRHLFVVDGAATLAAIVLAASIPNPGLSPAALFAAFFPTVLAPAFIRPVVNERFGLYRRLWGFASVPDLTQILFAAIAGTAVSFAIVTIALTPLGWSGQTPLQGSFWLIEMLLSLCSFGGIRFLIRAVSDLTLATRTSGSNGTLAPALLYGAGREGGLVARATQQDSRAGVLPVGFLDADRTRHGSTIAGLPVYGDIAGLDDAIRRSGARMLLITMSNATGTEIRAVMARAQEAGLEVRRIPSVHELVDGSIDASRIRPVRVDDLLTREQVTVHASGVADVIRDQVVMVTGAGGSIGSELTRQIHTMHPRELVLVDRAESPLYMVERELELRTRGGGSLSVHLANVASRETMRRLIGQTKPSIIFHAAACKHVPMMELHPSESVQVNVGGTLSVLDAAVDAGVDRFVLVSTDKAVEPRSVMGATKRIAESLIAEAARQTGRPYVSVRFGNVLGSAGSVLPIFQQQLERGEPLTVTDPDMTRFFMTIQEAGWLILDAAAIGDPGDLFVLDMGEPVRILDMARDLIRLSGRSIDEVPIRFTGLRPGEKLHEKLFYETETVVPTEVEKILRVIDPVMPDNARDRAKRLVALAFGDRDAELRAELFRAVELLPIVAPSVVSSLPSQRSPTEVTAAVA